MFTYFSIIQDFIMLTIASFRPRAVITITAASMQILTSTDFQICQILETQKDKTKQISWTPFSVHVICFSFCALVLSHSLNESQMVQEVLS